MTARPGTPLIELDLDEPDWLRCAVCGRILGEAVDGLALVRRGGRRGTARRVVVLAVYVACPTAGCWGDWRSERYADVVDRARGLRRVDPAAAGGVV